MSNLAILPLIIPAISGVIVAFTNSHVKTTRLLTKLFTLVGLAVTMFVAYTVFTDGAIILETGGWIAPYGIILVADKLSILLVLTTNIIMTAAVFYAPNSLTLRQETHYFYTFYFMLIAGVTGAFLTGDLFNLFVFFEVLLMASYALIVLGGDKVQLRESIKYVLINLFSSMLFVTAIALLYGAVGTINMGSNCRACCRS